MKQNKLPAKLWILAGIILSLLTLTVTVYGMHSTPAMAMNPDVVVDAVTETLDCVRSGDYEALGQMLYSAPDLGEAPTSTEDLESKILLTFLNSIQYRIGSDVRATDSGVSVDVHITCMDISALSTAMQEIVPDLMNQIANEIGDEKLVYNEDHNYRDDFIDQVLRTAAEQVLADAPQTMDKDLTLDLVQSGGRWQVVPTDAFVKLLSGYVSE